MRRRAPAKPTAADVLLNHRRALLLSALLFLATAVVFLLVGLSATRPGIQRIDKAVFSFFSEDVRNAPTTWVAHVLNILGGSIVTIPLRIAVSIYLIVKRRWRAFSAWAITWIVAEACITLFKVWYARPRPPDSLVSTTGFSFPSGHAVAAAATAVALVIVLLPPGPERNKWEVRAVVFALVMALSRVYLNAHWLSDAVAGTLLGAAIAIGAAGVVTEIRDVALRRRERLSAAAIRPPPAPE